jgi:hypothetical protein
MRGPVTSRAVFAAIAAALVLLAAGGGYAIASGSSKQITACVHRHGGGLYTGKCHKHDKKLTWNTSGPAGPPGPAGPTGATGLAGATGPQGPGATTFAFNGIGTSTATPTTLGKAGPFTVSAECLEPTSGTADMVLLESGPGTTIDGFDMITTGPHAVSIPSYPAHPTAAALVSIESTSTTQESSFYDLLFLPSSGSRVDLQITLSATGGTTNTCDASVLWYPTS